MKPKAHLKKAKPEPLTPREIAARILAKGAIVTAMCYPEGVKALAAAFLDSVQKGVEQ